MRVNEGWGKISFRDSAAVSKSLAQAFPIPTLRKVREGWGTHGVGCTDEIKSWATRPHPPLTPRFYVGTFRIK